MGRLIDADKVRSEYMHSITLEMDEADLLNMLCDIIDNAPTIETISKADYENRLKADMVAMLTEIQLEIEEMENPYTTRISGCAQGGFERGARESQNLIQQKINALKAESEEA